MVVGLCNWFLLKVVVGIVDVDGMVDFNIDVEVLFIGVFFFKKVVVVVDVGLNVGNLDV